MLTEAKFDESSSPTLTKDADDLVVAVTEIDHGTTQQRTKLKMSQVSMIFACGSALFSDGYANGIIGPVNTLITRIYGSAALKRGNQSATLSSVSFAGTIVGMLLFGYLSDKVGRKFGMMFATGIVALFSGLSAASTGANHNLDGMLAMLSACRFILVSGVGAEYPCGSVAAAEQTEEEGIAKNAQQRWLALSTNTMIDFGFLISAFIPIVLLWIFGENHLRAVWRLSLGLGTIPALFVLVWRLRMEEPTRFKRDSMVRTRITYTLVLRRYWKGLLGVSMVWFVYDFITYPFSIYSSTIINNVTGNSDSLVVVLGWAVVINLFYMPGTVLGASIVDRLGPKYTLILGLLSQAVIGFIMSGLYDPLSRRVGAFAVVYGVFLSLGEVGPGNCTILLAAKTSPTAVRGQYFGIAAAIGKVGAFVGTFAFPPINEAFGGAATIRGNTGPFWIASGLAAFNALVTFFLIQPLTVDGLKKEDAAFRRYLEENGWDTSKMGVGGEGDCGSD